LLGLGLAAIAAVTIVRSIEGNPGTVAALMAAGLMILAGAFEGVVVGIAQWMVLRRPLPRLNWRPWVTATAIGALAAWTLGMMPSTLMSLDSESATTPSPAMSDLTVYSLAAALGIVAGAILALPQWLVLRRFVNHAAWWMAANAAAWAAGMPIVFIGAGSAPEGAAGVEVAAIVAATIACAGAVVGAIHGPVLLWLLESRTTEKEGGIK
jgi:hypothetical protein